MKFRITEREPVWITHSIVIEANSEEEAWRKYETDEEVFDQLLETGNDDKTYMDDLNDVVEVEEVGPETALTAPSHRRTGEMKIVFYEYRQNPKPA